MAGQNWNESWDKDMAFINPYVFAALGGDVIRGEHQFGELTGKIACTLTVKKPLAVPDTEKRKEDSLVEKHYYYPFFRVGEVPTIPGSQLRGAVRSVYEAFSNSCLSVNNNNILSARKTKPRSPGILQKRNDVWHLYNAEVRRFSSEPKEVDENMVTRQWKNPIFSRKLKKEGKFDQVAKDDIYIYAFIKHEEVTCERLESAVEDYKENLKIYEDNVGDKENEKKLIKRVSIEPGDPDNKLYPVYYEIVRDAKGKNNVYLSPSQIGRSVYAKKLDDLLGSHCSCSKRKDGQLCKACALFGTLTAGKRPAAFAGQVRFTDASAVSGTWKMRPDYVTLKELSSPKTTSVEFYTERPNDPKTQTPAMYWSYEGIIAPKPQMVDIKLNGRKFYYHAPELNETDYAEPKDKLKRKTKRNSTMELCEEGSQFRFEVYFERITQEQLHELVWTLMLGKNQPDSSMQYKIGHGKPLGLGDVKITVDSIETRRFDSNGYRIETIDPNELTTMPTGFDKADPGVQDLMKILNVNTLKKEYEKGYRISYPKADNGRYDENAKAAHQWFKANRESGQESGKGSKKGGAFNWNVQHTLPRVRDERHFLPGYYIGNSGQSLGYTSKPKSTNGGNSGNDFANHIRIVNKSEKHERRKKK